MRKNYACGENYSVNEAIKAIVVVMAAIVLCLTAIFLGLIFEDNVNIEEVQAYSVTAINNEADFVNTFYSADNSSASNKEYLLTNDLTLTNANFNTTALARDKYYYSQKNIIFNGNYHTITLDLDIKVLYQGNYTNQYFGIFGYLSNSSIKNLKIKGSIDYTYFTSTARNSVIYMGVLAGLVFDTDIDNVWSDVNATYVIGGAKATFAGGLVGEVRNRPTDDEATPIDERKTVKNVLITGEQNYIVSDVMTTGYVGGLAGKLSGVAKNISQYAHVTVEKEPNGTVRSGGVFAVTILTRRVDSYYVGYDIENVIFSNGFNASSLFAFPQASGSYEAMSIADPKISTCMSFATYDPYRFSSDNKEQFVAHAKAIAFDRQFFAYRLFTNGEKTAPDYLPMLCWKTLFDSLPVPTTLTDFFEPASKNIEGAYEIKNDEEFNDMSLFQCFSTRYTDLDMRLKSSVKIDNDFLPFQKYVGKKFDGGGYSITVPENVTIAAIKAGIFAFIEEATITNVEFIFYGKFTTAVPVMMYASGIGADKLMHYYDEITVAINNDDTDMEQASYDKEKKLGTFNHAAFICYAKASEAKPYKISNISIDFNGRMEVSSKYWCGEDSTAARAGALVGEEWHYDSVSPVYENCLIFWRGGEILDSALPAECNNNDGIYVRLDVGVFWNGSDQNTVSGLHNVWTIAKQEVLSELNSFHSRGSVVTGCLIKEMTPNTINSKFLFLERKAEFYLMNGNGVESVLVSEELSKNQQLDESKVVCASYKNVVFNPNNYEGDGQAVLYAYSVASVSDYVSVNGITTGLPTMRRFIVGSSVNRSYNPTDEREDECFFGFDNSPLLVKEYTLYKNTDITWCYLSINQKLTEAVYSENEVNEKVSDTYGKTVSYAITYSATKGGTYTDIERIIDAGYYKVTATYSDGSKRLGEKTYDVIVHKAALTVIPAVGQKSEKSKVNAIADINIDYACAREDLLTGSLTLDDAVVAVKKDYKIVIGTLRPRDEKNYYIEFVPNVTYEICNSIVTIRVADGAVLTKVYDGTSTVNVPYTVVEGEDTNNLCSLTIGDKTDVGKHQILLTDVAEGYDVKLITAYYVITPKPITVSVTGGTEKQYDNTTDCNITYSANGLVSADRNKPLNELFSGALSYAGGSTVNDDGYAITLGSLSSKNYDVTLDDGERKYVISKKQILISVTSNQSREYNRSKPDEINDIKFTYSLMDGSAITLPYSDVFTGALRIECSTDVCNVLYDEPDENGIAPIIEYKVLRGTLSLGDNYELVLANNGAGVTITPREVADVSFPDNKEVVYTPNSNVHDVIKATLGAEILSEDRVGLQPKFKLYKYNSDNSLVEVTSKPGVGSYKCVTTGEFTNRNYRMLKIGDNYMEYSVDFTITPYALTKANFDFADVTTEFSGQPVSVGIGTPERMSGNDYPGVEIYSSRYEDQNNNSSDGMQDGMPYLAGIYRQICVFKCSENYSCSAIASTTNDDYIEIKRNIIVGKKALNLSIRYNNSENRTTPYLATSVSIEVLAYGNTLQESVTLDRSITMGGLTADSIFYVGKYTIKYTFNPYDGYYIRNYRLSDGSSSDESEFIDEFEVTKATPTVKSIVASDITYETSVGFSVITATVLTPQGTELKGGTFSFTNPNVVPDAGYYDAEVVYTPGNTYENSDKNIRYKDNYNSFLTKVVIHILPQTVLVTPKAGSTQEYDEGSLGVIEYTTGTITDKKNYGIEGALSAVALDGTAVEKYVPNTSYKVTMGTLRFVKYDNNTAVDTDNYVLSLKNGTHTVTPKKILLSFSGFEELRYNHADDNKTLPCKIAVSEETKAKVLSKIYRLENLSTWTEIENPFDADGNCKMLDAGYYKALSSIAEPEADEEGNVAYDKANYVVDDTCATYFFNVDRMVLDVDSLVAYETTTFDYNGNVRALKVKETDLPPGLVITYKNNANVYTGTYTVSVFVTSTNKNYTLGGVALSATDKYEYKPEITINKYKVTEISVAGIDELIYNGAELNIVADFVGVRTEDNVKKTYVITRNGVPTKPIEAGDYTMTVDIQENDNYELDESCDNVVNFTIKKQKLGLQALQTIIKVYNGNTSVAVTPSMFALKGIIGNDEVTIADGLTANFKSETTGINKEIVVSDVTLSGADKDNYYVDTSLIKIAGNIEAKRYDNTADSGLDLAVLPIKDSNIPLNATLKANLDSNGDYKSLKKTLLNNNEEIYKVFTYGIYGENGEELTMTNPVKLSLNTEGSQIKIYTLNGEELSEVEYTMNGTYAEFNADSYQKYVVTVDRKPNNVLAPLFKSPFFYVGLVLLAGGVTAIIVITVKKRKGAVK